MHKIALVLAAVVCLGLGVGTASCQKLAASQENGLTLIDQSGRAVTVAQPVERIVSIASAATETLYAIGCGELVVGVDEYSDYPPEAKDKPDVGTGSSLNVEKVLGLEPDLVVAWWYNEEAIANLEGQAVPVLAINPESAEDVMDTIKLLGLITDHTSEAEGLVASMKADIDGVASKTSDLPKDGRPLVYYELSTPMKTTGPGTFTDELIRMAGGINLAADEPIRYPILSNEYIIDRNPDVIVVVDYGSPIDEVKARDGWANIDAVKDNRVYQIDTHLVTSNPRLVQGLEQFARWFHPDLFGGK
jgi:iron complex transport system substrate-binding protein